MHLRGFVCMRTPGARERIEFDLFECIFVAVKHVIRAKYSSRDPLDITRLFGCRVDVPQSGGQGLRGQKIPDGTVNPLLILGDAAIELVVDPL